MRLRQFENFADRVVWHFGSDGNTTDSACREVGVLTVEPKPNLWQFLKIGILD